MSSGRGSPSALAMLNVRMPWQDSTSSTSSPSPGGGPALSSPSPHMSPSSQHSPAASILRHSLSSARAGGVNPSMLGAEREVITHSSFTVRRKPEVLPPWPASNVRECMASNKRQVADAFATSGYTGVAGSPTPASPAAAALLADSRRASPHARGSPTSASTREGVGPILHTHASDSLQMSEALMWSAPRMAGGTVRPRVGRKSAVSGVDLGRDYSEQRMRHLSPVTPSPRRR